VATKVVSRLQERIDELPEGSFRRKVLESARRFKTSWVELGRLLSQVRSEESYRAWGHESFHAYCAAELFLTRATADKLTVSYGFLERREPELLGSRDGRTAPPFEVIEVLSRAEAAGRLDDEAWDELRQGVLEGEAGRAEVAKRLAARFGPEPGPKPPERAERLRRLGALARRLSEACEEEREVPPALRRHAKELADALERLAE